MPPVMAPPRIIIGRGVIRISVIIVWRGGDRLERRVRGAASESAVRRLAEDVPVTFMAYDVLFLDGHLLLHRTYAERRDLLEGLELNGFHWQTPSHHVPAGADDGVALLAAARGRGLAGVVAKRLHSPYRPGRQSANWIEIRSA